MMGERGVGDVEFLLNFADDQAFGMRGEQELHDAQAGFGAHGGKHVRVLGDLVGGMFGVSGLIFRYLQKYGLMSNHDSSMISKRTSCTGV